MKNLTRRELFSELFSRDTMRNIVGTYREFDEALSEANKISSCDDAGRMIGKKAQKHSKKFFQIRKEG
ncbi:MAG: hypothetical protein AB1638_12300 [Nitrospirota bacterium]